MCSIPPSFFVTDEGERRVRDEVGLELDGIDAVARQVFELLRDLALFRLPHGRREMTASVRDAAGVVVYRGVMTIEGHRIPSACAT